VVFFLLAFIYMKSKIPSDIFVTQKGIHMIDPTELLTKGLINVDYPNEPRKAVEKAAKAWREFCELPKRVKQRFNYEDMGNLDGAGYELKETAGHTKDLKENFHITLDAFNRLNRTALSMNEISSITAITSYR
jgi:hypothetical protein